MKKPCTNLMRFVAGLTGASVLAALTAAVVPAVAQSAPDRESPYYSDAVASGLDTGKNTRVGKPAGANPFLALLRNPTQANYNAWSSYLESQAEEKAAQRDRRSTAVEQRAAQLAALLVDEDEPEGTSGSNDTYQTAQPITRFGTGGRSPRARIVGSLDNELVSVVQASPSVEDDGSIPLARDTGLGASEGFATTGEVGDGPHGSSGSGTGDFDAYEVHGVAGKTLTVDMATPTSELDTMVLVVDSDGGFVAFNDDDRESLDSYVTFPIETTGSYYIFVTGFNNLPLDPFDSASGDGAGSEGPYQVTITQGEIDVDVYGVLLRVGDTVGLSQEGGASFSGILGPRGVLLHGSDQDASYIYPLDSPLPGGGDAVNDHVADRNGWHYILVANGSGRYEVTAEVYRPGSEGQAPTQTVFVDFNGARINTAVWGGPGVRELSPLRSFLGGWGLTNADYRPLVREILATVEENVRRDLAARGVNPDFRVRILNSFDHADPWGQPGVSRVIVGGTIEESGVSTIGIAQSIDPGNFEEEESALVLLDILSAPSDSEFGDASLNFYLRPASDRVGFVGQAIGNVTSHEAGHFFGNWHVDQFNDRANLMDQGGNFPVLYGVGPDGVGGTADDPDVDFGDDVFNPSEGFTGLEDTLNRIAAALTQ